MKLPFPSRALAKIAGGGLLGAEIRRALVQAVVGKPAALRVEDNRGVCAARRAIAARLPISTPAASASRSTHSLNGPAGAPPAPCRAGTPAARASAGRTPRARGGAPDRPSDRRSCRLSVTLNFLRMPCAVSSGVASLLIGLLPDARGAGFIEQFVNAEVALQFQMRPVIERIAQRVRHGGGPGLELLKRRRRRRCKSARPRRWNASRAICSGRLPARFQRDF